MIYFIGAGSGAVDLITVRGAEILKCSQIIIYAGSLVNYEIIKTYADKNCEIYDSSKMTLDEISEILINGHERNLTLSRLHSGDPSIYGAIREQINILREKNIEFEIVPGVSSLCSAAAALKTEYMIPEISQTLIISRIEGRTPSPKNFYSWSRVLFLSAGMIEKACESFIEEGFSPDTPAAIAYKVSWPDEKIIKGNLATLPKLAKESGIEKTALILVGEFLNDDINTKSKLYDKNFSHGFRK